MWIQELTLQGILSFAPGTPAIEMKNLNVLIGPNGSGKSNLIEAVSLLRSTVTKLTAPIRSGGGVKEWIWKGRGNTNALVGALVAQPQDQLTLQHHLQFTESSHRFELLDEAIETRSTISGGETYRMLYGFMNGRPMLSSRAGDQFVSREIQVDFDDSILAQRKDPDQFPELSRLAEMYSGIRIYREWTFGRNSVFRTPQSADLPSDRLEEDFSNLGLILNRLRAQPKAKKIILERLRDLYAGLDDFDVRIQGGTVEVFLTEGDFVIPASRLSDGTLRYLCLLAILCDPDPPPVICIEEPELGLHPDILPQLTDLMLSASKHSQLIVTTHSDMLVDALTDQPESIIIMEKHEGQTEARRLQSDSELQEYLKHYRLGEMWLRGITG